MNHGLFTTPSGERRNLAGDFSPHGPRGGTFQYMQALHGEIEWMNPGYVPEAFDPKAVNFAAKKKRK